MLDPTASRSSTCYTGLIEHLLTYLLLQLSERLLIISGYIWCQKEFLVPLLDILDLT